MAEKRAGEDQVPELPEQPPGYSPDELQFLGQMDAENEVRAGAGQTGAPAGGAGNPADWGLNRDKPPAEPEPQAAPKEPIDRPYRGTIRDLFTAMVTAGVLSPAEGHQLGAFVDANEPKLNVRGLLHDILECKQPLVTRNDGQSHLVNTTASRFLDILCEAGGLTPEACADIKRRATERSQALGEALDAVAARGFDREAAERHALAKAAGKMIEKNEQEMPKMASASITPGLVNIDVHSRDELRRNDPENKVFLTEAQRQAEAAKNQPAPPPAAVMPAEPEPSATDTFVVPPEGTKSSRKPAQQAQGADDESGQTRKGKKGAKEDDEAKRQQVMGGGGVALPNFGIGSAIGSGLRAGGLGSKAALLAVGNGVRVAARAARNVVQSRLDGRQNAVLGVLRNSYAASVNGLLDDIDVASNAMARIAQTRLGSLLYERADLMDGFGQMDATQREKVLREAGKVNTRIRNYLANHAAERQDFELVAQSVVRIGDRAHKAVNDGRSLGMAEGEVRRDVLQPIETFANDHKRMLNGMQMDRVTITKWLEMLMQKIQKLLSAFGPRANAPAA